MTESRATAVVRRPLTTALMIVALAGATLAAADVVATTPASATPMSCTDTGCPDPSGWATARWNAHAGYPAQGTDLPGANCTNYVAWRFIYAGASASSMNGFGNANQWDDTARTRGYAVDGTATVGSLAEFESGTYGHIALVEQVNGDGTIVISESNFIGGGVKRWLQYRTIAASTVSNFIHIDDDAIASTSAVRFGTLSNTGVLKVKENSPGAPFTTVDVGVTDFDLNGRNIATVHADGYAYVKLGALDAYWIELWGGPGAANVYLDGDRYAVRTTGGELWVKDGLYSTNWTLVGTQVAQASISSGRIGVRLLDGTVKVKEGALNSAWTTVGAGTDLSLAGNRIAIVGFNGIATVKEGGLSAPWTALTGSNAVDVELTEQRIAVLLTGGAVDVKQGSVGSVWTRIASAGVADLDLSGDRIGVRYGGGVASVKSGAISAPWTDIDVSVAKVAVA